MTCRILVPWPGVKIVPHALKKQSPNHWTAREALRVPDIIWCDLMARRRQWHPTPVLLPGKIPWAEEPGGLQSMGSLSRTRLSDLTFIFHFPLSCIGEGNGKPVQCSCLENPRDRGAWWAAIYGVAQSWTRLKRLSSSSRSHGSNRYLLNEWIISTATIITVAVLYQF